MSSVTERLNGLKQRLLHRLMNYLFIVLYLAVFFGIFTSYRRLLLVHYGVDYEDYGISMIRALVLGKVVLMAETLRLGRGFEDKPLAVPTLYKTLLFAMCLAVYEIAENFVRGMIGGLGPLGALDEVARGLNYEWLSRALVMFVAFIPFFAVRELRRVLGNGVTGVFWHRNPNASEAVTHP